MIGKLYILPTLVANRYVFNRVIRETEDSVIYGAVQRDIQRDVVVETLRPERMQDPLKVQFFLETARLQANVEDDSMGCSLELFFADDTWHYARESIQGESLESLHLAGRKLSSGDMCELMIRICRSCIYMDIVGVDNKAFALSNVYTTGSSFRYDNPVVSGNRARSASRRFLCQAAAQLPALLDAESPMADRLLSLFDSIRFITNWSRLEPILLDEKLVSLQAEIIHRQQLVSDTDAKTDQSSETASAS